MIFQIFQVKILEKVYNKIENSEILDSDRIFCSVLVTSTTRAD